MASLPPPDRCGLAARRRRRPRGARPRRAGGSRPARRRQQRHPARPVSLEGVDALCVYKPTAGERPLWDFPNRTLAKREVGDLPAVGGDRLGRRAADDAAGGRSLRPRQRAVVGPRRSAVDPDDEESGLPLAEPGAGLVDVVPPGRRPAGWLHVVEAMGWDGERVALVHADDPALRRMAVLDAVANNADRKGGHILRGRGRARPRGRPRADVQRGRQAAHGAVGLGRAGAHPRDAGGAGPAGVRPRRRRGAAARPARPAGRAARCSGPCGRVRALIRSGRHPRPGGGRPSIPWPAF